MLGGFSRSGNSQGTNEPTADWSCPRPALPQPLESGADRNGQAYNRWSPYEQKANIV